MTALRNQIVKKVEPRIDRYLSVYKIPYDKLTLAEKTREIAKNIMKLSHTFEAKHPAFRKIRRSQKYYDALENYLDQDEKEQGFEGFDNGDMSYEDQHFLPIAAMAGKALLKGGLKKIAGKAKGLIGKVAGKLIGKKAEPTEPSTPANAGGVPQLPPNTAFAKIRDNVLDHGVDKWLTDKKKKTLDRLIAESNKKKFSNDVKSALISFGVSPNKFKNYMDENGDFSGEHAQKLDAILKDLLVSTSENIGTTPNTVDKSNKAMSYALVGLLLGGIGIYLLK